MSKPKKQPRARRKAASQGKRYFIPGNATDHDIEALVDGMLADEVAETSRKEPCHVKAH